MALETLASMPSLGCLYARAVLPARGRGGRGDLPERTLRVTSVPVDRDRLARYQRLCGFPVSDILPQTYPHVVGFPLQLELMARRDFPMPLAGLIHVENSVTQHRPLTAEDRVTVSVAAADLRAHRRGTLVDLVTTVEVDGERAWDGRSTYLRRGGSHPDATGGTTPPGMPDGPAVALWRLPAGLGRRYASVSGDVNPIHLNPWAAKAMGFPRAIAHGMLMYARALAAAGPAITSSTLPAASTVWFRKPVLLPGAVELVVSTGSPGAGGGVRAGLRSAEHHRVEHLLLELAPTRG